MSDEEEGETRSPADNVSATFSAEDWAMAIAIGLAVGCGLTPEAKRELRSQCRDSLVFRHELIEQLRVYDVAKYLGF